MVSNTTISGFLTRNFSISTCDNGNKTMQERELHLFHTISWLCYGTIAALSLVAVAGNTLILTAIRKSTFPKTTFHDILIGLALTDLCTGLIAQPLLVVNAVMFSSGWSKFNIPKNSTTAMNVVADSIATYFISLNALMITLMSLERWFHMTHRSFVISRCRRFVIAFSLVIPIPLVILGALSNFLKHYWIKYHQALLTLATFCITCTSISYFNVIRIIRQHRQQVQSNASSFSFGQPAINLVKYHRSLKTIAYIFAVFNFCFLPYAICVSVHFFVEHAHLKLASNICLVLLFSSSSLNPLLYVWRMKDVRIAVKQLFCLKAKDRIRMPLRIRIHPGEVQ